MRFQIASDLHLEMLFRFPGYRIIEPAPDTHALILAGDIHSHTHAIRTFSNWPVPVFYVHGNHEAYDAHYYGVVKELTRVSKGTNVHFLERAAAEAGAVRILGTCLWTDYALGGDADMAMRAAAEGLLDHTSIRVGKGAPFTPELALTEHMKSRSWLQARLALPFEGTTVVISHHGPHPKSVHPRYGNQPLNAAFVSDLTPLIKQADVWVHGHVHDSFDYMVGKCRVVVNPRGYALNRKTAKSSNELEWENPAFDAELVIEV